MAAPLFEFRNDALSLCRPSYYASYGKRLFDLALVAVMLPVVVPVVVLVALLASLGGGRPLYSQLRVGRDGETFRCWKFRTMIPDADAALARILADDPALAAEWQQTQKLRRDPRVTRFGAFLRKTSLDELPQLWNVVTGTMSIVGPRPFTPDQQDIYPGGRGYADYYRMLPGLTGLWQVSPRNRSSFAERAIYDSAYFVQLGLLMDLRIILRTVGVVLRGTGV
jgi:lipopolysaccharide/colanic/teichoic acid biosynthesis glycosyltransferase